MLLAVVVFGLCSCEDDKDPVLQKPTEFVLNQPATSELYYLSSTYKCNFLGADNKQ